MNLDLPPAGIGITPDDWAATPLTVRQCLEALMRVLAHQQQQIADQQQQIAQLQERVADLEARLTQHSQNSSKPPSSDPPSAPPRAGREKSGRKAGGQMGHPRHERLTPEPDQIDQVCDYYPDACPSCHDALLDVRRDACAIQIQYVWELPIVRPHITAHHYHTVCCPGCGVLVSAERPADVPKGAFGPRTAAAVTILHGDYHLSDRAVSRLLHDFFALPLSLGSVVNLQQEGSAALETVYTAIHTAVQQHQRCNIDETGWKEAGKRRWLWTMVTAVATFFAVLRSRDGPGLRHLLGASYGGIVGSDRHRPYLALAPDRHQLCWSHLLRNFQALSDRKGRVGAWGADFLALSRLVFRLWHLFREGTIERAELQAAMAPIQATMHALLVAGARRVDAPEGMCQELLKHEQALWTFVREERVEPTNNAAEQALRGAVLWRKRCFGAQSAEGNRFVERILSVSATCRQQQRHLLTFVEEAISAYWAGRPAPALLPAAPSSPS
jgi:transposase